jgi:uncharacterized protein YjhX (UPF0386 family)
LWRGVLRGCEVDKTLDCLLAVRGVVCAGTGTGVMVSHLRGVSVHGEGPHCKLSHTPALSHTAGPDNDSWVWGGGCSGIEVMEELFDAAFDGDVAEVQWLVAEGVDVNVEDEDGWRPLHAAAQGGHVEVVTTLAELGADVNAAAADGRVPLHFAAHDGHAEVARTLVELGADVHAASADGAMPLHYAAEGGHVEVVRRWQSWGLTCTPQMLMDVCPYTRGHTTGTWRS